MVLHFREATSVYRKTFPYVLLQLTIGVLFALLGVVYVSMVVWLVVRFFFQGGGYSLLVVGGVMIFALASYAFAWYLIKKYFLYAITAGHIAVIAHVITEDEVPENQISYGLTQFKDYFGETTILFGVSVVIDAVLKQFNRSVARVQELIPLPIPPQLRTLIAILQKSITLAVRYLDNAIIAYMFVDRAENRWKSARDGLVLYGKTWKMVLGSTLVIVVGMYVLSFVLFTLLAPLAVVLDFLPTSLEIVSWVLVGGTVAAVHTGLVKPWVKTVVITTFLIEQRDHQPDSETMEWMTERSDRFGEVMEKAETDEPPAEDVPDRDEPPGAPSDAGSDLADD